MRAYTKIAALMGTASAMALAMGHAAYAQTAAPAEEAAVEQIVVTGSRLTTGFNAPTPVTVVGAEAMEQRAPLTMGEITNEIPAFKPSGAGQGTRGANNPAAAQNTPNLRGLGSNRSLVLVDGRRVVSHNTAFAVDTNMIPTLLVDRLEVVTGGASAAYGSDAVAGVANFVLKSRVDGIHGTAQYGASQHGENTETSIGLATGKTFFDDRLSLILGGEWANSKTDDIFYDRRDGQEEWNIVAFGNNRPAGTPAQGFARDVQPSNMTPGGLILSGPLAGITFDANGQPRQLQFGTRYGALMVGSDDNPGVNGPGLHPLSTPYERASGLFRATFEVTPDISVWAEAAVGWSVSVRKGGNNLSHTSLTIHRDNPFLPASIRQAMVANNLTTFNMGRIHTDTGAFKNGLNSWGITNELDTRRAAIGARGKLLGDWTWDVYAARGKTKLNFVLANNQSNPNTQAAVWAVTGPNGAPVCGDIATNPNLTAAQRALVEPGCQPWNAFGSFKGSEAAYDYINPGSGSLTSIWQDSAALSFAGSLIELPAGPVAVAFGAELRKDEFDVQGDSRSVGQVFGFGSTTTYKGENTVKEGFLEVGVPLVRDAAFARTLDVNGAIRRTDYKVSGAVTTWKLGGSWEPNDAIRFRGTVSRDIRAPTLQDLFQVGARSLNFNIFNPINGQTGTRNQIGGGNPNLKAEKANTFVVGAVLQPTWEWASGFRASVDYYNIKIKDAIGSVNSAEIMQRCASGDQQYCAFITFDNSVYGIALVRTSLVNNQAFNTDGIDLEMSYRVPPISFIPGRFEVRYLHTWVNKYEEVEPDGTTLDRVGSLQAGISRHTGNLGITYAQGRFAGNLQARWTSKVIYDATLWDPTQDGYNPASGNSINKNMFPSAVNFNLSAQYNLLESEGRRLQLFGVVNNLLDKDPPAGVSVINFNNGNWNPFDVIGRSFRAGIRFQY
jgi:iron complex outermembrane receptor protein